MLDKRRACSHQTATMHNKSNNINEIQTIKKETFLS